MTTQSMTVKTHIVLLGKFQGSEVYRVQRLKVSRWNKLLRRVK